ncbi:Metallo-beta-lactamase superfamily protein [Favolaschia claudopus]|uniref:Metallo-beta-lactamase superfamily protein n=1 Tax=Favolaschia claudopus TaxID=2862362 RepID=A0AAW0DAQ4_9AGAR
MSPPTFRDLGIPVSNATVSLKVFNVVRDMREVYVSADFMMKPVLPGREMATLPIFAFLIENAAMGQRVMFDLGPRKDQENAAPPIPEWHATKFYAMPVDRDITEQLDDNGVDLKTISAVIWSHAHFDHTGDVSKFPASTNLVFGPETKAVSYLVDSNSDLVESDLSGRDLVRVDFDKSPLEIGGFKANDFFGDGSFYLLDVPGHLAGHLCALARVTPTSFVLLGGDCCHHPGMLRPTSKIHRHYPCPGEIFASARRSVSATHFPPPDAVGEFDLASRTTPMLDVSDKGVYADRDTARKSIEKIGDFDVNSDVFVALAHDESLVDVVGPFPALLNDWQAKDWKNKVMWAFLDEANPAFRFSAKTV